MLNIDGLMNLLDLKTHVAVYCRLSERFSLQHDAAEATAYFHLLLQGGCVMRAADGRSFQVRAGDFCLWANGGAHLMGDAQGEDVAMVAWQQNGLHVREQGEEAGAFQMLCGSFLARNRAAAGLLRFLPEPMIVSLRDVPQLYALAQLVHEEAQARQAGSVAVIESLCSVLLLLALRKVASNAAGAAAVVPLFADAGLARAAQAILANPFAGHTIDGLAHTALMSRATFARKFQTATGMGVQQFVRLLKMSAAAKMLRENKAVSWVAEAVGYQSEAAFVQAFRAQFACTPSAYRKQGERPSEDHADIFYI